MVRIEKIQEYMQPYVVYRIKEKIREVENIHEESLVLAVRALLRQALDEQTVKPGWQPAYLGLLHLLTGMVTGSHEYNLLLADSQMYLDRGRITGCWCPPFLYQDNMEEENARNFLQKKFVRLNDYEISCAVGQVFYEYRKLIGVYWKKQLSKIVELEEFKRLTTEKPFLFLFGDFMGKVHICSTYIKGDLDYGRERDFWKQFYYAKCISF